MQNMTHCPDRQLLSNFGGEGAAECIDEGTASLTYGWKILQKTILQTMLRVDLILQVRRERRALASLDYRQLRDIGIDSATAAHESRRSHFDIPTNRLHKGRCN